MTQIKTLFDPSKDIYRTIEKVITYNTAQEVRLKTEITEYIATDSIETQLERLLTRMQDAMNYGGENEIGVWVSGFYGSGKSSFTKYLGLALDESVQIEGTPFLKHLQDRLNKPTTRSLLSAVSTRFPMAVIMLDLASEMVAGATMEDVSTVLYYKVLQWAGYSQNLKVARLERHMKKDGRYQEFTGRIQQDLDMPWTDIQNDPLVIDSVIPELAHEMYPALFKTPTSFNTETVDIIRFETDRVQEMLDIVQEEVGKQHILFVVDEVGQYVGSRPNLILNLDGLAKNLKQMGDGKVWIIGTAQQTLTEDDPRIAFNSPELYKLKDRFPIQIDLESHDIKEICYKRLLGKSSAGVQTLGTLFDQHGQALRHSTKLENAPYYDADFDRTAFTNLYPFLPAHFDILLHLLGQLAKSTGGIGLRSAIKVVQDILIEGPDEQTPVADREVGWLATTVTLYDSLEKDIQRAYPPIHAAVGKVQIQYPDPDTPIHQAVAKTVAVLQIMGNMPITSQNIASLLQPSITGPNQREQVDQAIQEMTINSLVPFGEKDGGLCFFSEKLNEIDQERAQIPLRSVETRRIQNEALREAFSPLPSSRLQGTLSVTAGLKTMTGNLVNSIAGERGTIQMQVEFVPPTDYETIRIRLIEESRSHPARYTIYLLGRADPKMDELSGEIWRCQDIANRYRTDPDQEVKEYCAGQTDRAAKLASDLQRLLKTSLRQGSFIFRGQVTAVDSLNQDVRQAAIAHLSEVAEQVFDRYSEAPYRAGTDLAEKFLRLDNLKAITTATDPLELVQLSSGTPSIATEHKALLSIRDYLDRNGTVEGKSLTNYFTAAPFGWLQDTLRYLVAAMLVAGEIKLKVSGREVTVKGQQAIEALRTNNAFRSVGISQRDSRPSNEVLSRAADRLTKLTVDRVIPLEDDVSKAAIKCFPRLQQQIGPLAEKLRNLNLPGADNVVSLGDELADILLTDASDAPQRFGGEQSPLYDNLQWAEQVDKAFKNGLENTLKKVSQLRQSIQGLPDSGLPGQLQADLRDELDLLDQRLSQDTFYEHATDFNSQSTNLQAKIRETVVKMEVAQQTRVQEAQQTLQNLPSWIELSQKEQQNALGQLEDLVLIVSPDWTGLQQLLNQDYVLRDQISDQTKHINRLADQHRLERLEAEKARLQKEGKNKLVQSLPFPVRVQSLAELEALISRLQSIRTEVALYNDIDITFHIEE